MARLKKGPMLASYSIHVGKGPMAWKELWAESLDKKYPTQHCEEV